jgi:hypothetical protein
VRESRLSALGESLECPVLAASNFLGPVVFLIRLLESAKGPLVVIVILLAVTVLVRSFDQEHSQTIRSSKIPQTRRAKAEAEELDESSQAIRNPYFDE